MPIMLLSTNNAVIPIMSMWRFITLEINTFYKLVILEIINRVC